MINVVSAPPGFSRETGIQTQEPLITITRFPGVSLQSLEHLSISVGVPRIEQGL